MIRSRFHPVRDIAAALTAVLVFAWLAWLASHGVTPFDTIVREAVHAHAQAWMTVLMKAASAAGGGWVLWPGGALILALLARAGRVKDAVLFAIAVVGANILDEGMKLVFHRARPESWFGYPLPFTYSFPSGHAFVSFCFFLCLAEILVCDEWSLAHKAAVWGAAAGCTLTIGYSRVYLGVHYPTDVLAGYAAATAWTTTIRVARHLWRGRRDRLA